jgi:hypothetical protein
VRRGRRRDVFRGAGVGSSVNDTEGEGRSWERSSR